MGQLRQLEAQAPFVQNQCRAHGNEWKQYIAQKLVWIQKPQYGRSGHKARNQQDKNGRHFESPGDPLGHCPQGNYRGYADDYRLIHLRVGTGSSIENMVELAADRY